jgi:hypothetical protein
MTDSAIGARLEQIFSKQLSDHRAEIRQSASGLPPSSSLEAHIDRYCECLAKMLGKAIRLSAAGDHPLICKGLRWVFGQYRGTAVSGERQMNDFYSKEGLGTEHENLELLRCYWQTYGLGSSIGELFFRTIQRSAPKPDELYTNDRDTAESDRKQITWHCLRTEFTDDVEHLTFDPGPDEHYTIRTLRIPHFWLDWLLPGTVFDKIEEDLKTFAKKESDAEAERKETPGAAAPPGAAIDHAGDAADASATGAPHSEQDFRAMLSRYCDRAVYDLLSEDPYDAPTPSGGAALRFLGEALEKEREKKALAELVRAVQLLSLYWKWAQAHESPVQELLVLFPLPAHNRSEMTEMPRIGFAALLNIEGEEGCGDPIRRFASFFCETLIAPLQEMASDWTRAASTAEKKLRNEHEARFSGPILESCIKTITDARNGSHADAVQLLRRVLPTAVEMARLAPSFLHEGRRYGIDVILGLPYHEQIIGRKLAIIDNKYKLERFGESGQLWHQRREEEILEPIISSSYSLLAPKDIVLFGRICPGEGNTVQWSSMLKLHSQYSATTTVRRYEALTDGHGNLFAISVGEDSKVRFFGGGKLLAEYWRTGWWLGAGTESLEHKIRRQLATIGVFPFAHRTLKRFATLIQRISETPGAGTLVVITPDRGEIERLKAISAPPEGFWADKSLPQLLEDSDDTLFHLATMDGAIAISAPDDHRTGEDHTEHERDRSTLNVAADDAWKTSRIFPRRLVSDKFDLDAFRKEWTWNDLECLSYGSRRASALALAMQSHLAHKHDQSRKACLCIVVSADGPIYLMRGGKAPIERLP